jgi:hypothetical protein
MNEKHVGKRKRVKHELAFEDRLLEGARKARDEAAKLPPGTDRERLMQMARENEMAAQMSRLMALPRLSPVK